MKNRLRRIMPQAVRAMLCAPFCFVALAAVCPIVRAQSDTRAIRCGRTLNHKAVHLPQPEYTAEAANAGAAGSVTVEVSVDEEGVVRSAKALRGHPLLRKAAEAAAYKARFPPTFVSGEKVKVSGELSYNFVRRSSVGHTR